jgi:hypothetical protein
MTDADSPNPQLVSQSAHNLRAALFRKIGDLGISVSLLVDRRHRSNFALPTAKFSWF